MTTADAFTVTADGAATGSIVVLAERERARRAVISLDSGVNGS